MRHDFTPRRILVIDDDSAIRKILKRLFECEGYIVDVAPNGTAGLDLFRRSQPCALVLDLRLRGMTGQEVCREIKETAPELPIIVLSASSDVADKILLLDIGAHDYVTKPFSPRELLARVRAALRHSTFFDSDDVISFDDVTVSLSKVEVMRQGEPIAFSAQEFRTLAFMIQNAERVISRKELLVKVWGYENDHLRTRTVDNHMSALRHKLEKDPSHPVHFRTIHSVGYKFVP